MDEKVKKVKELLKQYDQEHLLQFYSKMGNKDKEKLVEQIEGIDFDLMKKLYQNATKPADLGKTSIEPIDHIDKAKLTASEEKMYTDKGIEAIKTKKFAVVTMAGGQGTRLGHNGPKGTYDIGLSSHKSIFEILCDNFKKAREEYGVVIPWYIMTSRENNEATEKFFEDNNYFDYPKEAIKFFIQGELPMVDLNGKILLDEKGFVKEAADGHGGTLKALGKGGILKELK